MSYFDDSDIRYYIKCFSIGLFVFVTLGVVFFFSFHESYDIKFSKNIVNFKENIEITDLVLSIGKEEIKDKNRISSNTICLDDFEVTFDELNTKKVGAQEIKVKFSNEKIKEQIVVFTVVEKEKPIIQLKQKEPITLTLNEVKQKKFADLFIVKDNYSKSENILLNVRLKEKKFTFGDKVHLLVEATDENKNTKKKSIAISIKEKEVIIQPPKEEVPQKNEGPITPSPSLAPNTNVQPNIQSQMNENKPQVPNNPVIPKPNLVNKQFLFSQGYDMETAPQRCQLELFNSGQAGACVPLQDANGIYIGMELRFH